MTPPFWIALAFFAGWCSGVLAAPWFSRSAKRERAVKAYVRALTPYVDAMSEAYGPGFHETPEETLARVEHLKARYEKARDELRGFG